MKKILSAAAGLAVLSTTSPALAVVVYDNGLPTATDGNEATAWVQAEDFSFGAATTIGGAGVYLAGFDGIGNYDGQLQYYLFSDGGGIPGTILQSGSVTPTITDSGLPWCCGGNAYLFEFDFADFAAAAGVTYYFGIHASGPGDFNRDDIYWVSTAANNTTTGLESDGGTFDNWSNNGVEHAFFLTDGVGVVPEPASWAMMIAGFGLVGVAMRGRRSGVVSYA